MEYGSPPDERTTTVHPTQARQEKETKHAFKTTEFWVYVLGVLALLLAGLIDDKDGSGFTAQDVWLYFTLLTVGYLLSRGIAKSGSRDPDVAAHGGHQGGVGERVKAAAQVLREGDTGEQRTTPRR